MVLCPFPRSVKTVTDAPYAVSIVTTDSLRTSDSDTGEDIRLIFDGVDSANSEQLNHRKLISTPGNFVKVVDLRRTRLKYSRSTEDELNDASRLVLLPSRFEREGRVNFTICVCPLHGDTYDWMDIVRFVEVYRVLGQLIPFYHLLISRTGQRLQCVQVI